VRHEAKLVAVLNALRIERAIVAGHDARGRVAVSFTLDHPDRVSRLVLLNTYYGMAPQLRFPEMIRLFADPALAPLANAMTNDPNQRPWLLGHTGRMLGLDPARPEGVAAVSILPQFFGDDEVRDALAAIRAWSGALSPALASQNARIANGQLANVHVPVSLTYGGRDDYLSPRLAGRLASLFGQAELCVLDSASHWPHVDEPKTVARILNDSLME
jgi:haloalkane dehalogenase